MKIRRTQPPVGYRAPLGALLSAGVRAAVSRGYRAEVLEPAFARECGVGAARAVSSGKAALSVILRALHRLSGRRTVIVPAYTCYSVPSAVLAAGLDVVPCDIGPSFDYDYEALAGILGPDVLCVLSVHLFGMPADVRRLKAMCRPAGAFVVEDAAQAFGIRRDGVLLGTTGDAGFFSLGRGKHLTAGAGGVIVSSTPEVVEAIDREIAAVPPATAADGLGAFGTLMAVRWLITPAAYWLPAGLPFLRLGETIFHDEVPVRRLSDFQAQLLRDWPADLERLNDIRRANGAYYLAHVSRKGAASDPAIPYLRFPVVLPGAPARERLLAELDGGRFGISRMYPGTLADIPQVRGRLRRTRFPQAEHVAASLVTLPTHPLVSPRERSQIAALVNDAADPAAWPLETPLPTTATEFPSRT